MGEFLYRQAEQANDRDHTLKRIIMVPVMNEIEEFGRRFGIDTINSAYGSTEASVVMLTPPNAAEPGKIGWLRPDFEARLVDENDIEVPLGTAGELVIRSKEPWVMMNGYHGMPEATAESWRNLWFHTGDTMRQDECGMFIFVDRSKDAIRRRGENVSSFEVEREILAHKAVAECAVVAVASNATEDDIKACIVLRQGMTVSADELINFLRLRLPYFMLPRYIDFLSELPRTPTEKIRKQELRKSGVTPDTWDGEKRGISLKGIS
jgi:crotonobetaine/carnitine-CoA ligase